MTVKRYHIETFGCQMNKSDSELMELSLREHGFAPAESGEAADIVIFNTCSVRAHAESRALSRMRSVPGRAGKIVVAAGCMAQRTGGELVAKGDADLAVGPYQSPRLGELVNLFLASKGNLFVSQEPGDFGGRINPALAGSRGGRSWHEWVTITHGCGNFCSYCIVPYVRGRLISFSSESIIDYVKLLADRGAREITLLGQNVNQYGIDSGDMPFHALLEKIAKLPGLVKINFLTSHPKDFTFETLEVIRDNPVISRSIHLPLQSGSDRVLSLMNRNYSLDHYMRIVDDMRRILDDHSVSTDLIVGFPGETDDEFRATLDAVRNIRFDEAFMYAYSPRLGTKAASLEESLIREEKLARLNELIALQREISREKLRARIDRTERALVESISKKSASEVMGKTFLNHTVVLPGAEDDIGRLVSVKITGLKGATLYGARTA
jgi:tRNA-2-methylthio-N6-dimethylallyladenosine synthase